MQQEASTFSALLEGPELMVPELFSCAWDLWRTNMYSYVADPTAAASELQAAAEIFVLASLKLVSDARLSHILHRNDLDHGRGGSPASAFA